VGKKGGEKTETKPVRTCSQNLLGVGKDVKQTPPLLASSGEKKDLVHEGMGVKLHTDKAKKERSRNTNHPMKYLRGREGSSRAIHKFGRGRRKRWKGGEKGFIQIKLEEDD